MGEGVLVLERKGVVRNAANIRLPSLDQECQKNLTYANRSQKF